MAQQGGLNKTVLVLITFFLGGIGAHKFYLQKYWQGVFYLLFCWTLIPGLIALIEFFIYLFTSEDDLQEKYPSVGGTGAIIAIVLGLVGMVAILGILAAISIPAYYAYVGKSSQAQTVGDIAAAEAKYFAEHNKYTARVEDLDLKMFRNEKITIEIIEADEQCFKAVVYYFKLPESVSIDCHGAMSRQPRTGQ